MIAVFLGIGMMRMIMDIRIPNGIPTALPLGRMRIPWDNRRVPSGKHTKNYGRSPFFMAKSTTSMESMANFPKL